jgi:lyso-ornithine lipid O-acyltransferase
MMMHWRRCKRATLLVLLFVAGLAAVAFLYPVCDALPGKRGVRERVQVAWYRAVSAVLGIRVRRFGRIASEPVLWAANHISWLDIVVLGAQGSLTFVAKAEVGRWPVIGFMARRTETLLVRRGDMASSRRTAEAMAWLMRKKRRVMLFPEGTSTPGDRVARFHARLFQPLTLVGGSVQAVALDYRGDSRTRVPFVGDDEFLPHLWRLLAVERIDVDLHFCEPLPATGHGRDQIARRAYEQILAALGFHPAAPHRASRSAVESTLRHASFL